MKAICIFISLFTIINALPLLPILRSSAIHVFWKMMEEMEQQKFETELFSNFQQIKSSINDINQQVEFIGKQTTIKILNHLPRELRYELHLNELKKSFNFIDKEYETFVSYTSEHKQFENQTKILFFNHIVSHDPHSLSSTMSKIYSYLVPSQKNGIPEKGFLEILQEKIKDINSNYLCDIYQSPQLILKNFYELILVAMWKGILMIQYAYIFKKRLGEGNYIQEREESHNQFLNYINNLTSIFQRAMANSSREFWRCDPDKHIEGKTFIQIKKLLQGYIRNKSDFVKHCNGRCENLDSTDIKAYNHATNYKRCNGKFIKCFTIADSMDVCHSRDQSTRKYDYLRFSGLTWGNLQKSACQGGNKIQRLQEQKYWIFDNCPYCMCICDVLQDVESHRFVNLRLTKSDTKNNRVITGLRFIKINKIIHLQIQEGKLLPMGAIDNSTITWVPVDKYKITDANIFLHQDYHVFTNERRTIDLETIEGEINQVLVGVRFKIIGGSLTFEILLTPFDYTTGKLIDPENKSFFKDNLKYYETKRRTELKMIHPDIPTRSKSFSWPDSKNHEFIELTYTDLKLDLSQSTVPFFDAQNVELINPVPLSGAGIYHKGSINSGGFIAPKIVTYDVSQHMQIPFPNTNNNKR